VIVTLRDLGIGQFCEGTGQPSLDFNMGAHGLSAFMGSGAGAAV
jgi:hypothetical protein